MGKRKIILPFVVLKCLAILIPICLSGQNVGINDSTYYHNLSFVIQGGINQTQVVDFPSEFETFEEEAHILHLLRDLSTHSGIQFNIGVEYQLNKFFSVQSGLEYMRYQMEFFYMERYFSFHPDVSLYLKQEGSFNYSNAYFRIPLLFVTSFGKKVKGKIGIGSYWSLRKKQVSGEWRHFDTSWASRTETGEWEVFDRFVELGRTNEFVTLPIGVRNFGALVQAQLEIPLTWNLAFLLNSQLSQEFGNSPSPSISTRQLLFNTGIRFRLKYD